MESTHETDSFENGPLTPTRVGAMAGIMDVVVFTAVGYIALDDIAIGGITGLLVGTGIFCFLPLFVSAGEDGDLADLAPADDDAPLRGFHRLAAGFALSAGGMVFFATGFAEIDRLVGLPAALAAAGVVYLGAGFVLPNAQVRQ